MASMVNTVLGKVSADSLGKTLMHEHFVFGYPGFDGDCTLGGFDWEKALIIGLDAAKELKKRGVKTVVDATTNETGRNPELYKEIAERTGLQIICSTGYYFEGEGAPPYFRRWLRIGGGEDAIYEMFMEEITNGIAGTGVKPGVIKLASSDSIITEYEAAFFKAAAKAQKETGIPVITHTQAGTMGAEQAELLLAAGADPNRIIIGHMCGCADIIKQINTLKFGVTLGFDRFGIDGVVGAPSDQVREGVLIGLIGLGYGGKIVLSQDKVLLRLGRASQPKPELYLDSLKNWHICNLFDNVVPVLEKAGISGQQIDALFNENIKHVFGG
jgi:phosphotriesterase-related protein